MAQSAQYASTVKMALASLSAANTNRDGTGTLVTVAVGGPNGTRIDKLITKATGITTAGMVRYFLTKGRPGATLASLTFVGTTATATTTTAHGLSTNDKVTVQGAFPDDYNVLDAAVTVLTPLTFTFVMATTPTVNATVQGSYSTTVQTPTNQLWREVAVAAITPSATVAAFSDQITSSIPADQDYLPLHLPPGYSLRAATEKAEAFKCIAASMGDF